MADDAILKIVLEDSSGPAYTTGADIPGVAPPRRPNIPASPPVSSSPEDEGTTQSRFYRRYPWAALGGGMAKPILPPGAYSGVPGGTQRDTEGPLPLEPWPGANKGRDSRGNPMGETFTPFDKLPGGPKDHINPKSVPDPADEKQAFQEWMGRKTDSATAKEGNLDDYREPSMMERFQQGFARSIGPSIGASVGAATGSPTLGGLVGGAVGGGAESLLSAAGPAGLAIAALGTAAVGTVEAFSKLTEEAQSLADSVKDVSGEVAGAEAERQVIELQQRLRRAEEIGPELADFIRKQAENDAKWEELRNRLYKALAPLEAFLQGIVSWLENIGLAIIPAAEKYARPDQQMNGIGDVFTLLNTMHIPNTAAQSKVERFLDPQIPNTTF